MLSLTELEQTTVDLGGLFMIYTNVQTGHEGRHLARCVSPVYTVSAFLLVSRIFAHGDLI